MLATLGLLILAPALVAAARDVLRAERTRQLEFVRRHPVRVLP